MTGKQLKALAAVFVALVAILALVRWNANRPATTATPPVDLATLKESGVDKVVLASREGTVTLAKTSSGWEADGSPATTAAVGNFWKSVAKTKFDEIVSTNPANQGTFGVSAPLARTITFFAGREKKAELTIGSPTDSPETFYLKVGGGKEVWTATGALGSTPFSPDAWHAKPIFTPPGVLP